jgi:hypothetical protein
MKMRIRMRMRIRRELLVSWLLVEVEEVLKVVLEKEA